MNSDLQELFDILGLVMCEECELFKQKTHKIIFYYTNRSSIKNTVYNSCEKCLNKNFSKYTTYIRKKKKLHKKILNKRGLEWTSV